MPRKRKELKFNPIDTKKDVAVGLGLPFSGRNKIFHLNYTTEEQAITNLKNLILTRKGERYMQPNFGWGGWELLFEPNTTNLKTEMEAVTRRDISVWLPQIIIDDFNIEAEQHEVRISLKIQIEPSKANKTITIALSRESENITIEEG